MQKFCKIKLKKPSKKAYNINHTEKTTEKIIIRKYRNPTKEAVNEVKNTL